MAGNTIWRRMAGSAYALAGNTLEFYEECERAGGIVRTHCWGLPVYIVTEPALIEEIFIRKKSCFMKSSGLRANRRAFGLGLLTSDGELWQRQRKIMQPAFRVSNLDMYWPWVEASMERVLGGWGEAGTLDIHEQMTDLCFEVLAIPLFGEDMAEARPYVTAAAGALHDFHQSFSKGVAIGGLAVAAMRAVSTRLGRPDFFFDPSLLPTKYAKLLREKIARLDGFVYQFIERRRAEPPREDLMSILFAARDEQGNPLSKEQIRDEIVTMFFAGHETGAASISWALCLLAQRPEIAAQLAAEAEGGPLAHQVMHEALRLYPPAYRVSRTVIETCQLGLMEVPAGAEVVIPQWAVHRSPRNFEEPNEFRPERWTTELMKQLPKFAYFPFGGGQRICIGNNFGLHEGVRVVAEVVRRFELKMANGSAPQPVLGITLLPKEGSLRMEYRKRRAAPLRTTD